MKFASVIGIAVLSLTVGCTVSQAQQDESKPLLDKRVKAEQSQSGQSQSGVRWQNVSTSQGVGLIPNDRYRVHFGPGHKFHLDQSAYGKDRRFRYGGYSFGFVDEWPTNWRASEDVFVLQIDGGYYLANSTYPGVNIPLNIAP